MFKQLGELFTSLLLLARDNAKPDNKVDMNAEEIKSYLGEAKGRPISIHLSDGREFSINHPDFLQFHPIGNGIFLFNPTGGYIVLNRQEITSLEIKGA